MISNKDGLRIFEGRFDEIQEFLDRPGTPGPVRTEYFELKTESGNKLELTVKDRQILIKEM